MLQSFILAFKNLEYTILTNCYGLGFTVKHIPLLQCMDLASSPGRPLSPWEARLYCKWRKAEHGPVQQSTASYLLSFNSIVHHPVSWGLANCRIARASLTPRSNAVMRGLSMCTHAYKITKWHSTQWTAAVVCLEFSIALVNSYEDIMDQDHFVLRYESFSWYNHSEYLSHYRDSLVDEKRKNNKIGTFITYIPHTFTFSCLPWGYWAII